MSREAIKQATGEDEKIRIAYEGPRPGLLGDAQLFLRASKIKPGTIAEQRLKAARQALLIAAESGDGDYLIELANHFKNPWPTVYDNRAFRALDDFYILKRIGAKRTFKNWFSEMKKSGTLKLFDAGDRDPESLRRELYRLAAELGIRFEGKPGRPKNSDG